MERYTRNVLVVEPNPIERERLAAALEREGFQAFLCSGPTQPDYTCLGARAGTCPLASQEAVVVLDMSLDSDAVMSGTPAEDLLGLYLESGHPVVALDGSHRGDETGRLIRLRRHPETDALVTAVWQLASPNDAPPRASEKDEHDRLLW
jgi:CheY-like chemotaxis protein